MTAAQLVSAVRLHQEGRLAEAEAVYRQILQADADVVEAHNNLGCLLQSQGRAEEALACFQNAAARGAESSQVYLNLGNAYHTLKRDAEAAEAFQKAVQLNARHVEAHAALGFVLQHLGKSDESIACFRRALELRPDDLTALANLATALQSLRRLEEAEALYRQCASRMSNNAGFHFNFGQCLQMQGKFAAAESSYAQAVRLDPAYAEARYFLATVRLTQGRLAEAWADYEWRHQSKWSQQHYDLPVWDGRDLQRQEILIHSEWGLGDTLQFVRYVPLVQQRGGRVVLAVQAPLIPLLEQSGFPNLIAIGTRPPATCRLRIPILSLPRVCGTTLTSIPAQIPYLKASSSLVDHWRERLRAWPGFKIAIHWGGSQAALSDARAFPLNALEPLARVAGVTLIGVQKGPIRDDLTDLAGRFTVVDVTDELDTAHGPFMDTAAIMKIANLVVTSDTSTVHLAAGLGVTTWLPLSQGNAWMWFESRDDSPWYPTLRLFRQTRRDDWSDVFTRMARELEWLAAHAPPHCGPA